MLLVGLAAAWFGIEVVQSLRITLFQPFRMATVGGGLCLVLVAGHVSRLVRGGKPLDWVRSGLIVVGLAGDWSLVVVTCFEAFMVVADRLALGPGRLSSLVHLVGFVGLGYGWIFLSRHDTESGHVPRPPRWWLRSSDDSSYATRRGTSVRAG